MVRGLGFGLCCFGIDCCCWVFVRCLVGLGLYEVCLLCLCFGFGCVVFSLGVCGLLLVVCLGFVVLFLFCGLVGLVVFCVDLVLC